MRRSSAPVRIARARSHRTRLSCRAGGSRAERSMFRAERSILWQSGRSRAERAILISAATLTRFDGKSSIDPQGIYHKSIGDNQRLW